MGAASSSETSWRRQPRRAGWGGTGGGSAESVDSWQRAEVWPRRAWWRNLATFDAYQLGHSPAGRCRQPRDGGKMRVKKFVNTALPQLALLAGLAGSALAEPADRADWPQFRGAHRDGRSAATALLKEWPEAGPKTVVAAADRRRLRLGGGGRRPPLHRHRGKRDRNRDRARRRHRQGAVAPADRPDFRADRVRLGHRSSATVDGELLHHFRQRQALRAQNRRRRGGLERATCSPPSAPASRASVTPPRPWWSTTC